MMQVVYYTFDAGLQFIGFSKNFIDLSYAVVALFIPVFSTQRKFGINKIQTFHPQQKSHNFITKLYFSTMPGPSKKFDFKLFAKLFAAAVVANTAFCLYMTYPLSTFVVRMIISLVLISIICSPLRARLNHINEEFNAYVDKKNKILRYDWVFLLLLSPYVFFYDAIIKFSFFFHVLFYLLFVSYVIIALARIYYVYEKKNP